MRETATIPSERWDGCYGASWAGIITPASFAHPAKFARGLIDRIVREGLARGWWQPGDLLGDPFGGVGTGGIVAAAAGLRWVGVELEHRFVEMARANFALQARPMFPGCHPEPRISQGDSRRFAELVGQAAGVVTSPPYSETLNHGGGPDTKLDQLQGGPSLIGIKDGYGTEAGQIGSLPAGDLAGVDYGVVTSPPYIDRSTEPHVLGAGKPTRSTGDGAGRNKGDYFYPKGAGQIGGDMPETYWQAMAQVYRQCRLALRPGGYMAVVIKDYVRDGKRVPLCDDTLRLLLTTGFEPVLRARAMLTEIDWTDGRKLVSRKSFFRRLAEKKGSPAVDHEEVLVVRSVAA